MGDHLVEDTLHLLTVPLVWGANQQEASSLDKTQDCGWAEDTKSKSKKSQDGRQGHTPPYLAAPMAPVCRLSVPLALGDSAVNRRRAVRCEVGVKGLAALTPRAQHV